MSTEVAEIEDGLSFTHLSPTICAELAAGLISPPDVPAKYSMSQGQWERLKASPFFISMLKEAGQKFKGDLNSSNRITLKSEIMLEDSLPILDGIIHNGDGSTQSRLDGIKQLSVLAGRTQNKIGEKGGGGAGFAVNIHINTGEDQTSAPIVISGDTDE